ncbi:MAG: DUF4351 domain-containing protein, partial [Methylococcaceae bacterium]|nr:DUF4351 domain-containing protein [Methylococcaceae bacterium]
HQPRLTPTLAMLRLIASHKHQTISLAQELSGRRHELGDDGLDFLETILVYKLPHLSREEIKAMLALNEIELKQTRFYQEIAQEEKQKGIKEGIKEGMIEGIIEGIIEGKKVGMIEGIKDGRKTESIALLTRLLRRKLGLQPALETLLLELPLLSLESLENLADVLLDLNDLNDLQQWLAKNGKTNSQPRRPE